MLRLSGWVVLLAYFIELDGDIHLPMWATEGQRSYAGKWVMTD